MACVHILPFLKIPCLLKTAAKDWPSSDFDTYKQLLTCFGSILGIFRQSPEIVRASTSSKIGVTNQKSLISFAGDWVNDDSVTLFYRLKCTHRRRIAYLPNLTGHRIYKFQEQNRLESETFTYVTQDLNHHGRWRCQLQISKGASRAYYRWDSQYGEISLSMW